MSTFKKDIKLGTMVPQIRGDDIADGSVEWEHLSSELQSIVVKIREEDIRLADINLSRNDVEDVISGRRASRLRVISSVSGTVCVIGMLEMYSCADGSGIVQLLHTEFELDKNNKIKPTTKGEQHTYLRKYNIIYRTWSRWEDNECISNQTIDKIVHNVYKQN